jgi:hypothetical protein
MLACSPADARTTLSTYRALTSINRSTNNRSRARARAKKKFYHAVSK